jgi:hypothetical protein
VLDARTIVTAPLPVARGLSATDLATVVAADALVRRAWALGRGEGLDGVLEGGAGGAGHLDEAGGAERGAQAGLGLGPLLLVAAVEHEADEGADGGRLAGAGHRLAGDHLGGLVLPEGLDGPGGGTGRAGHERDFHELLHAAEPTQAPFTVNRGG